MQKANAFLDWSIIAVLAAVAIVIIVGYLQPVVEKQTEPRLIDGRAIKVQLFGGCRRPGDVMQIAESLRKLGIDVVEIENESGFTYPSSLVVDRLGNPSIADSLCSLLGLPEDRIVLQKYSLMLDATIVIGLDYPKILEKLGS